MHTIPERKEGKTPRFYIGYLLDEGHRNRSWHHVREITQLSLSANLVTLSACNTATGKLEGEEGVDGLAEAFLLAGAKSVVGALWNVDDSATDTLMRSFYIHLATGEDKASPLRQARLDYLERLGDRPPIFWAGFKLLGDGSSPIAF
jgi:CHAT domain-containing protein